VNPKEVGLGMSVAAVDTLHVQGSLQSTGVGTDLAIQGSGFFILDNGGTTLYTRAGGFNVDEGGTLVNPSNGMKVQGWMAREVGGESVVDTSRTVENLVIPVGSKDPARATTRVNFACNLDKRLPVIPAENATEAQIQAGTWTTQIKVFDTFGGEHTLQVQFTKALDDEGAEIPNTWNAAVAVDPEAAVATNAAAGLGADAPAAGAPANFTVAFSNEGTLVSATDAAGNVSGGPDAAGSVVMNVAYDVVDAAPGADGVPVRQQFQLNLGTIGGFVNSATQYAETSSTKAFSQDGYTMGYMENFKIDASGVITGVYSNGSSRVIGQIALATFANQGGLEKAGDTAFRVSNNSGAANVGPSGIAGKGTIRAGSLEMSNVDMAEQFTDMIVTQRGFQANSRTIQTADQLLQELLTLKR
jgi:flagellar hook protein FlgE